MAAAAGAGAAGGPAGPRGVELRVVRNKRPAPAAPPGPAPPPMAGQEDPGWPAGAPGAEVAAGAEAGTQAEGSWPAVAGAISPGSCK